MCLFIDLMIRTTLYSIETATQEKILLDRFSWMVRHLCDSSLRHRSWSQLFSIIKNSTRLEDLNELTLSLPDCLMEFCEVTLTFESVDEILWCHHSNESSLPVLSHDAILFLTIFENEIWKFGRNLPLATFGSERVKTTAWPSMLSVIVCPPYLKFGWLYVSGKPPTYPFPKPTSTLTSHLLQNFGLGEG